VGGARGGTLFYRWCVPVRAEKLFTGSDVMCLSQPSYTSSSLTSGSCSSTSDSITPSTWSTGETTPPPPPPPVWMFPFPAHFLLFSVRDGEHANPWGESSPDDYRYSSQGYTDPREREREQHDMNKR